MKRWNLFSFIGSIIILISLWSCEEQEGDPLTVQEVLRISGVGIDAFTAEIGDTEFATSEAAAVYDGDQLTITATFGNEIILINTKTFAIGAFLGSVDDQKNFLNYQDQNGILYTSTTVSQQSDANIKITEFDASNNTISGGFSAHVYDQSLNAIRIHNGQFNNIPITLPFTGEMRAQIGSTFFDSQSCVFTSTINSGIILETVASTASGDTLSISITVEESIQEKIYDLASDPVTARYNADTFSSNIFKNQYTSLNGVLVFSSIDLSGEKVEGTFSFQAENFLGEKISITNGEFNALVQ